MRNSSWKGWFGAEVGFSIYIHRRGFTSSCTINHQSVLPASQGAWARHHGRDAPDAPAGLTRAPWEFASTRWATPPYRGHKAQFAPCETPPGWISLVLKLDSLYIYIGGVSHHHPPSSTNHRCYPSQGVRARRVELAQRATSKFAPTRWATPPYRGHKATFAPCETPPGGIGLVLKLDSLYIYIGGVSHHHRPSIITYSPARTRARECTTPRERNWSPAPPRRASGQLPTAEPYNPLGRSAATTRHWGCCGSSLPSCVRPSVMPDASWLLTEGRTPPPRPMEQLSAPTERRQCGVGWRGSRRAGCVSAAC